MRRVDGRMIRVREPVVGRQSNVDVFVQAQGDHLDRTVDSMFNGIYRSG